MGLYDNNDIISLTNRTINHILEDLEEALINDDEICTCRRCRLDFAAFILNQLPADYDGEGLMPLYREPRFSKNDLDKAIKIGVKRIKQNPRHN